MHEPSFSSRHAPPIKQAIRSIAARSLLLRLWRNFRRARQQALARAASSARFQMTREGFHLMVVVVFIFVGAVLRDINLLILIAAAMIGLLLLQWRLGIGTVVGLKAARKLPQRVSQGAEVECTVTVSNAKRWLGAWLILIEDSITQVSPLTEKHVGRGVTMLDELSPHGEGQASYNAVFHSRGRYRIGPCTLSTRFPLNLGRSWRKVDSTCEIIVHPKLGDLTAAARNLLHIGREGMTKTSAQAGVHATEFFGLRPWASGDSQRWIHWRTTARLGELSVRQFERLQPQQACILLDLYKDKNGKNVEQLQACERAISFVATLTSQTVRVVGNSISIGIAAHRALGLTDIQSPVLAINLLDELAVVAPTVQPNWQIALSKMTTFLVRNPYLLVVSTRPNLSDELESTITKSLRLKSSLRLNVKWLNATQGDLEPYFLWTPNESND